jgi:hypothetical protein
MGDCCETAEMPIVGSLGKRMRTNEDVVCEISYEMREVAHNLNKLKDAIKANPDFVSEKHKELWKKQAKAMQEYVDVLGERIKDLIGE